MAAAGMAAESYSSSGQAGGGGSGSVFGDLGGPGQQHGDGGGGVLGMDMTGGPRNQYGVATGNPSGDAADDTGMDISDAPPMGSVFGDLGGSGTAREEMGAAIPAAPVGSDPQGGR